MKQKAKSKYRDMKYWDVEGVEPPPPHIKRMWDKMQKLFNKPMSKKMKKLMDVNRDIFSSPADKTTSEDFRKLWQKK